MSDQDLSGAWGSELQPPCLLSQRFDPPSHLSGPCKAVLQADLIILWVHRALSHGPLYCVSSVMLTSIFGGRNESEEELPLDRLERGDLMPVKMAAVASSKPLLLCVV